MIAQPPHAPVSRRRWALIIATWISGLVAMGVFLLLVMRTPVPPPEPTHNLAFPSADRSSAPAEVWAVGDGAASTRAAAAVARQIGRAQPDRVLYLGDVYEHGRGSDFRAHFTGVYGRLVARMAPTPGNHDWPQHRAGYDPYWQSITGKPTPPWYAFDIGGWRLLSLNSETPRDSRQLRWLHDELSGHDGRCVLAFWHRPRHSAGRHGDQADVAPLWDAVRGRAAVVIAGHDHDLQRLRTVHGTMQVISGAGGRSLYPVDERDRRLAFSDDQHYGALRLRLRPGGAALAFVTDTGAVLDRTSVDCPHS